MRVTISILLLAATSASAQQPIPRGSEFQVNTYTTHHQELPNVASDGAGGFVVVWQSNESDGTDVDGRSVQGQRYATDGTPVGDQFQVNTYTIEHQQYARASPIAIGGFVVVWTSEGSSGTDTDARSVQGQRYAADGSAAGDEFQINTYTTGFQSIADVASVGDGFVVVWVSEFSAGTDTDRTSVHGRIYDGDGQPAAGEFQLNSYTTGDQFGPAVGQDGSGGFVASWNHRTKDGGDAERDIRARRFEADGTPMGDDFQVNTYTTDYQHWSSVSPDGAGGFVIAWQSDGSDGTDTELDSIQARRYAADGIPVGGDFQVNTFTDLSQSAATVVQDPAGGFLVGWSSYESGGTDTDRRSIQVRRYRADGAPASIEFQANSYTTDLQSSPQLGPDGAGGFVVAWRSFGSSGTDTSGRSVQAQRFLTPLFADGFESGDTSAWSTTVP